MLELNSTRHLIFYYAIVKQLLDNVGGIQIECDSVLQFSAF